MLAERYESVCRRCAPRGRWRTREPAELLAKDDPTAAAMQRRLSRWLAEGADIARLPSELEAAFVQKRGTAPARVARHGTKVSTATPRARTTPHGGLGALAPAREIPAVKRTGRGQLLPRHKRGGSP